jgi:hypothetical protein
MFKLFRFHQRHQRCLHNRTYTHLEILGSFWLHTVYNMVHYVKHAPCSLWSETARCEAYERKYQRRKGSSPEGERQHKAGPGQGGEFNWTRTRGRIGLIGPEGNWTDNTRRGGGLVHRENSTHHIQRKRECSSTVDRQKEAVSVLRVQLDRNHQAGSGPERERESLQLDRKKEALSGT